MWGFRRAVMAWTLGRVSLVSGREEGMRGEEGVEGRAGDRTKEGRDKRNVPVKGAGEDEVVIRAQLVEAVLDKGAVVDEPAGLVDDDEGVDGPAGC